MDSRTLRQRYLGDQVGAVAESVQSEPAAGRQRCAQQRPVADDPGAQQPVGERRRHGRVLCVAAVSVPARVERVRAQILIAPAAVGAGPVGMPQPRDADPVPYGVVGNAVAQCRYRAHDHVTRRDVLTVHRQIALADMQVGAGRRRRPGPGPAVRREPGLAQASPRTSTGWSRSVLADSPPRPSSFPGCQQSFLTPIIVVRGRLPPAAPARGPSIRFVVVARAGRAPGTPKTYSTPWACKPSISRSALRAVLKNTTMASARISIGKVPGAGRMRA